VSDGSYCDQSGAAAWIIEGKTNMNCIIGMMITPKGPTVQSTFWSELVGIYGILLTLEALELFNLDRISCRIACKW